MSEEHTSGTYRMEMLKAQNWMPWKRRMLAVLRDLGLEKYIAKDAKIPESADTTKPTAEELESHPKTCRSNREFELYPNSHMIFILSYRNQTHTKKTKAQISRLSGWHKW